MSVVINGTTGITAAAFDGAVDGADLTGTVAASLLTGDVAAARITGALNATGSAPIYACRAWVNFNGSGTVAIRASGNVSSITDNGTGDYTVNFTTAMPDANYCFTGAATYLTGTNSSSMVVVSGRSGFPPTTSALRIMTLFANGNPIDCDIVNVSIFR